MGRKWEIVRGEKKGKADCELKKGAIYDKDCSGSADERIKAQFEADLETSDEAQTASENKQQQSCRFFWGEEDKHFVAFCNGNNPGVEVQEQVQEQQSCTCYP